MGTPFWLVDAFAERPFTGNPAAVVVLERPAEPEWMQRVGAEFNLSETAFLVPRGDRGWDLRWFTPVREVDLCGHATLASRHVLGTTGRAGAGERVSFHTLSGVLRCWTDAGSIVMEFPSEPPTAAPAPEVEAALGCRAEWTGRNRMDVLVQLESEQAVRALRPDFGALASIETRGVIATAPAQSDAYDVVSRFFAPAFGVDEDPVTGSAHCAIAPFWCERLGRTALVGLQASKRSGVVRMQLSEDRVLLAGSATVTARGELLA